MAWLGLVCFVFGLVTSYFSSAAARARLQAVVVVVATMATMMMMITVSIMALSPSEIILHLRPLCPAPLQDLWGGWWS